jgi:hypothetical protein
MNDCSLKDLNELRKPSHYKDALQEDFLLELNKLLMSSEAERYQDHRQEFPFIFVFGLPRSGTTLISQLIAHCLDVGYINNLMARFWLAPLTGVRLSKILLGDDKATDFCSNYAATSRLTDIHEFGYFWRYWLKKDLVGDILHARAREGDIDWAGLEKTLLNIQHEFGKAMVFKNIFGAYHVERFVNLLSKVLFVYIERDPLDVAVSILDAREKFYGDLNTWWSTYPPEYDALKGLPYMEQIGGQVYYLRRLYGRQIKAVRGKNIAVVSYKEMCSSPLDTLKRIAQACEQCCDYRLEWVNPPPAQFECRQYTGRVAQRDRFKMILEKLAQQT